MSFASLFTSELGSLLHPAGMALLVIGWAYTAYLGFSARLQRTKLGDGEGVGLVRESNRRELTGRSHYKLASALLCATVGGMLLGMGNTFARTGRLFPGPHLYLGLGLVFLLTLNVSLVPHMKESPSYRNYHAVIGSMAILVLTSQVFSGFTILKSLLSSFA